MNKITIQKIISFTSSLLIFFQSFSPFFYVNPRTIFAQEVTPTAIVTTSNEQLVAVEPTVTPTNEPTVTPTVVLTPEPTNIITPTAEPTSPSSEVVQPTSTPPVTNTEEPTPIPSQWTFEKVELGKEYVAPQNNEVKLTFTKLPTSSGNIKIEEITLTAEQIKQTGSLSDKAYDITSNMKDGEFTYNLSLPIPESSKGKEVSVKFAEELASIKTAKNVENVLTNTDTTVSVKSLNHMTIFVVVYDALPSVSDTNYPSLGFQATQTSEFGDYIHLGGSDRLLNSVTVTMSDWAKYSSYTSDTRYSGNSTSWSHPITINIYSAELKLDGTPKTKLGSVTQNITIPWRPETSPECSPGTGWQSSNGTCYNGIAFNAVFDMSGLNLILPDDIIVGVAYNTNTWGSNPIGLNGPYESLNVVVPDNQVVTVGSDDSVSEVFWSTVTKVWYTDGGAAGFGVFRKDTNWTPNGTVAFKVETIDTTPACDSSSFDSFTLGSVNGQGGWSATGSFDQAIVKNSYGYSSFGCKSLRFSDAITSGSFGDQIFASPVTNAAGETSATAGSFSVGTRQNHFEAQFDIASTMTTQQSGMHISISPDRGDGSRMSYLRIEDEISGMNVFFDDVQGENVGFQAANFVETQIASNLSRTTPHTIKFVMDFIDGPSNDLVKIFIDNSLVHTGTSWENYYRFDSEAASEQSSRIVKTILFRASGTPTPGNSGKGFLYDNVSLSSSTPDTTAPSTPTLVSPADGVYRHTADTNFSDWSDVTDPSGVGYRYQSASNIGFTSLYYDSNDHGPLLTESKIMNPGEPEVSYFWRVQACDGIGNCSDWSTPRRINVDNTSPLKPVGLTRFTSDNVKEYSCGVISQRQTLIPTWTANTELDFDHYEYTSFNSDGTIGLNEQILTTNKFVHTWVPTSDGTFGYAVRAVDKAGNKSEWALSAKTLAGSCQIIYDSTVPTKPIFTAPSNNLFTHTNAITLKWSNGDDTGTTQSGIKGYTLRYTFVPLSGASTIAWSTGLRAIGNPKTHSGTYGHGQGTYTFYVKTTDNAGNISPESDPLVVTYDATAPVITINSYNTAWTNGDVVVTATTNEGTLNETSHTFTTNGSFDFIATDAAGNVSTKTVTITNIDKVNPTDPGMPVPSITSSPTNETSITWNWTAASDAISGIQNYFWNLFKGSDNKASGTTTDTFVLGLSTYGDGGYTFNVQSQDKSGNVSGISTSAEITIDTIAPVITINPYNTSWTNGNVIVNATSNEGTLNVSSHTFTTNGSFDFIATDAAGNVSTKTVTITNIDKQSPTVPVITQPVANGYINSPTIQTFIWTASTDSASGLATTNTYQYQIDNNSGFGSPEKDWSVTTTTWTLTNPLADGTYYIRVRAKDLAGNKSAWSTSVKFYVHTIAPTVVSVSSDGATYNLASASPTIKITFSEGIANMPTVEVHTTITGEIVANCGDSDAKTFCFTYALNNEEDTHTIYISGAQDVAGNTMTLDTTHTFIVDRIAPIFNTKTEFSGWYNTNQISTFNYTGATIGNDLTCDITTEGSAQTCSVTPNVCDAAGNCNTTPITSNGADIDKTNPESTITAPSNSGSGSTIYSNSWTGEISGAATDDRSGVNSVKISIQKGTTQYFNGTDFVDSATEILLPTSLGETGWQYAGLMSPTEASYTIKSHAIDNATNMESTYTLTIIFDKTIPEVTISLNPTVGDAANGWYKTQPEVTLTATDTNFDKIEFQWDSQTGAWTTYSAPFKPGNEGAHVLYYRAHDKADNYSGVGIKNIKWNKTDLKDGPLNVSVSPNPTSESTSKVKWDAATSEIIGIDKYEIQWKLKNGDKNYSASVGNGIREYTVDNLIEGVWEVKVTAFDASGNNKSASTDLIVDRSGPSAPTLSIFGTTPGSVSLSWSKIDGATNYIIWYGTTPGSYQYGAKVGDTQSYTVQGLGAGSYYFIVKAVDAAGNQSGNSNEVSTGAIAGAPGVAENTPAQGFAEEVLGANTITPTQAPKGDVLGTGTTEKKNPWWWPWILLLLLPPSMWLGYKKWKKAE